MQNNSPKFTSGFYMLTPVFQRRFQTSTLFDYEESKEDSIFKFYFENAI